MRQNGKSSVNTLVAIGAMGAVAVAFVGAKVVREVKARKSGNYNEGNVPEVLSDEVEMNETHMALADPARRYMR